ncbi:MAG: AMP nucleosidase [Bdellovibrionales bacterium]
MFKDAPYCSGPFRTFDDAEDALAYVRQIYDANSTYLRDAFERFLKGEVPEQKINAYYPYVALTTSRPTSLEIDTRLSYGFVADEGRYSTTLTRPDIFADYYLAQFKSLLNNHDVPLEVGASASVIPIHFAFQGGSYVEGGLSPEKSFLLREFFPLPDLRQFDDEIANGGVPFEGERPLSLFTAPRVDYSLQRLRHYTGTDPEDFQRFVIFTNYQFYVDEFIRIGRGFIESGAGPSEGCGVRYTELVEPREMKGSGGTKTLPQMPAYHLKAANRSGITIINIGVGPSNARTITDHVAVLRPDAWVMLGHCAGLRQSQRLGDYVLAHAYVRDDHVLDDELPLWVPLPALSEVQLALEGAVACVTKHKAGYGLKSVMRTGTVISTDNRNWEIAGFKKLRDQFNYSRAIALDMESAVIAANGYRLRVPYGTLLCVSDKPLHGEIKLPGMATDFYKRQVSQHLMIGMKAIDLLRETGLETLHSRKIRSYADVAFR